MNEWDWIDHLRRQPGVVGVGDDAAVLDNGLLVTVDTFVEGIHFRREWASWQSIGRKMAESAISDIAAMGGTAHSMLASLSTAEPEIGKPLLEGILSAGVPLVGGDTTGGNGTTVSLTVLGSALRPVLRSGAKEGDTLYVSGPLGGARAGLLSLEHHRDQRDCEAKFLAPRARTDLAAAWGRHASAMIDISDGLSSELHHLAKESNAMLEIDLASIPIFSGADRELALESGEEFELLAASPVALPHGIPIGVVKKGSGVYAGGRALPKTGYTHWA